MASHKKMSAIVSFFLVMLGKVATIAIFLVGGIIVARNGSPEQYGIFVTAITIALLFDGIFGTSMDLGAIRYASESGRERHEVQSFQTVSFHLKWALPLLLFGSVPALQSAGLFVIPEGFPVVGTILVTIALLLARSISVDAQIRQEFKLYSSIDVGQGLVRLALFLSIALLGGSHAIYFLGAYAGTGFLTVICGILFLGQRFLATTTIRPNLIPQILKFSGAGALVIACGAFTGRGDLLLLSLVQGNSDVAIYGAASQVTQLFCQLSLYASVVTQPRILQDAREGNIGKLFACNTAVVIGLATLTGLAWQLDLLPFGISLLFGEEFAASSQLLPVLLIGGVLDFLIVPVLLTFCLLSAPKQAAMGELVIAGLFFLGGIAIISHLEGFAAQMGMAWSFSVTRLIKLFFYGGLTFYLLRHNFNWTPGRLGNSSCSPNPHPNPAPGQTT